MAETALVGSGLRTEASVTTAQRIAGAVLIANAFSVLGTDAHLLVIAEALPEPVLIPLDALTANLVENGKAASPDFEIRSETPIEAEAGLGKLIEATAEIDGTKMRFYYGLFSVEGHAFQLIGFAGEPSFRHVRAGMRKAILSFAFEPRG